MASCDAQHSVELMGNLHRSANRGLAKTHRRAMRLSARLQHGGDSAMREQRSAAQWAHRYAVRARNTRLCGAGDAAMEDGASFLLCASGFRDIHHVVLSEGGDHDRMVAFVLRSPRASIADSSLWRSISTGLYFGTQTHGLRPDRSS